ncbi:MAG: nitroreductase family deazaflavin-dependent oxidoreductase [Steroidobacteraceae bacterium]
MDTNQTAAGTHPPDAKRLSLFLARLVNSLFVVRFLSTLNVFMYRVSGGRLMNNVDGTPVCLITMTRRKSGKRKTIALMYVPHGEEVLLVASLGGSDRNPAWYYNLKADPNVDVQVGNRKRQLSAHEVSPSGRDTYWPRVVAAFPSYADYQKKTTRVLPIFVCSPRG